MSKKKKKAKPAAPSAPKPTPADRPRAVCKTFETSDGQRCTNCREHFPFDVTAEELDKHLCPEG